MDNSPQRFQLIQQMQELVRHDAAWVFGFHPKKFSLFHRWFLNRKPHVMANNTLKYLRLDTAARTQQRQAWNQPNFWPLLFVGVLFMLILFYAVSAVRSRARKSLQ
jgi:oligopeptide transport system substrate-binding protein